MKDLKTTPSPTPLDLSGLVQRIVKNGLEGLSVEDQLSDFCTRIAASGFPIKRGSMGVRTLHPHYGALTHLSEGMRTFTPQRIVCLTEETTETLYILAEEDRIVSVSGCAVRPKKIATQPSWKAIPAVRNNRRIFEIKSRLILQPGPAALTDGLDDATGWCLGCARSGQDRVSLGNLHSAP